MKKLAYTTVIDAPREIVWDRMLAPATYERWTTAFAEGSRYEGSWAEGARILFLGPEDGSGMVSMIEANRRPAFLSILHLGMVKDGVEDTTSDAVKAWAGAHENYTFTEKGGGTGLTVELDVAPEFEGYMNETWPKALALLKEICEEPPAAG
ncbi:MAG: SRPBCC domain-containing protein [Holophagales bacterium]|jgi:uncharacterized protein YndB with AHSA1/START domain|nr:SRPBCC domain-containing protein [Holophagales bacterium]MBK9969071.1 SRPBCC domain-containing protein [Holophagales bacterium]